MTIFKMDFKSIELQFLNTREMAFEGPDDPDALRQEWDELTQRNELEQRILLYTFLLVAYFLYWLVNS